MSNSKNVWSRIDEKAPAYFALSDRIWGMPELNYQEVRSAAEHRAMLEAEGFRVTMGAAGLPTAVIGEAGEDGPVIAIMGEYDALPGLSQAEGVATPEPLEANGNGHGCGHNMLGSASLLAAAAVKDWLAAQGLKGRVRYYGCPAEEGGSSKGFMVRAGLFDDVDVALCWHPASFSGVNRAFSLACVEVEFTFTGRASHAAAAPHLGRSALDAVELMNIGVNYMREHMPSTARVHYAIIDAGGIAPNVVQAKATVRHLIRARNLAEMWDMVGRVKKIAEGAALMTETQVVAQQLSGDANLVGNLPLEQAMQANLEAIGGPGFDVADHAFAARFQATLSQEDIAASYARFDLEPQPGEALSDIIYPLGAGNDNSVGSTDVGTVSWVVPTVQCRTACYAIGTPGHSWQLVAQGRAPAAHKGLALAAKAMAGVAADVIENPALLEAAQAEFAAFRAKNPFVNPITDDIEPPLDMAAH
ncbi:MAG TPA: M20 family metallopeptidase [Bosea sp. (in: a-proteobacteria)]|jgi:aminobenzoyl-glutamate utilization protein B|uniref:M20 family metallopeptidase n=1 Tax=Bosea sp. (in: a-proteobacteria) TaxID=1871050 RepID=UPI002E0DE237|nr:M20 family metallopeptidase [Bosea sp. (in: a-proteobacteria)]